MATLSRELFPPTYLWECVDYNSETGEFRWRARPSSHFALPGGQQGWNKVYAGRPAFTGVDADGYFHGVIRYRGKRTELRAAHAAWAYVFGYWPKMLDHVNRVRSDNRIANLREATQTENQRNKIQRNKLGFKGVYKNNPQYPGDTYQARIQVNGRGIYLGTYKTAEEAHQAYAEAAVRYFGEFARAS